MTPIDPAIPAILAKFDEEFGTEPSIVLTPDYGEWHLKMVGFSFGYQLCAAEKQAEIDEGMKCIAGLNQLINTLRDHIATLEQQRQQDREECALLCDESAEILGAPDLANVARACADSIRRITGSTSKGTPP